MYPAYLVAVSSIRNLRTRLAMVTGAQYTRKLFGNYSNKQNFS
jgi:hypothetical protein